jgi:oligopeptide/dipeptide ABC transporter ATP-binding protein
MSDLLAIRDLSLDFETPRGRVKALRNVSFSVPRDKIVGLVGESGSGKTTVISAVLRLLPTNAIIEGGAIFFDGEDVLAMSPSALQELRGRHVAMVSQDPMTALSPVHTIGTHMHDVLFRESAQSNAVKRQLGIEMLRRVGIPDAAERIDHYPHQFSGGMRQRIAIAMALLVSPDLLIADEPTTALDVTLEAQIIHLLRELKSNFNGSILFVSHNLGLVAELCDQVVVMYSGEVVEQGSVHDIFHRPSHPYTQLLLACDPARIVTESEADLPTIAGDVPDLIDLGRGCAFAGRCPQALERCHLEPPPQIELSSGHSARCHLLERRGG